jgi:hypothetical protein
MDVSPGYEDVLRRCHEAREGARRSFEVAVKQRQSAQEMMVRLESLKTRVDEAAELRSARKPGVPLYRRREPAVPQFDDTASRRAASTRSSALEGTAPSRDGLHEPRDPSQDDIAAAPRAGRADRYWNEHFCASHGVIVRYPNGYPHPPPIPITCPQVGLVGLRCGERLRVRYRRQISRR